jgi:hypothetical protein
MAGSRATARPATTVKAASVSLRMPAAAASPKTAKKTSKNGREESDRHPEPGANSTMPDLRGTALRDALLRLRALGVEADFAGEGRVRDQTPAPGAPLRRGDRARLVLGWSG